MYALLTAHGLGDYQLLYHTSFMIETVFLKLPYVLSDLGIFLLILKITGRLWSATLFFLNPLVILVSSAWGMYDSLMLLALMGGILLMARAGSNVGSSLLMLLSGIVKLFGFLPYGLLLLGSIVGKRVRAFGIQLALGIAVIGGLLLVIAFYGGLSGFLTGFVFRFAGLSGGTSTYGQPYTIVYLLFPRLTSVPFMSGFLLIPVAFMYLLEQRKNPDLVTFVKWTLVGSVMASILSQSEPQWLSWSIPLAVIYGALTNRTGLQWYTLVYGATSAFLIMTQSQAGGYLVLGTKTFFIPFVEQYQNILFVYAATTFALLMLMLVYTFRKPIKFKFEIVPAIVLVYLLAYFWFSILNVPGVLGLA